MTAITLVNDACCGIEEHRHAEACLEGSTLICEYADTTDESPPEAESHHTHVEACYQQAYCCGYEEHIHSITCYSDPGADLETQLDWQEMFADYPYTGDLRQDLVGIAKTQVGYTESARNFRADDDGVRHGYTRFGAWYGAPYNDWSAMFVSFCLNYAGADPAEYPTGSGADTMAMLWDTAGKLVPCGTYVPVGGDLVFFSDNTVGIVAEVQNATIYVIAGNVDDAVTGRILSLNDGSIEGWGILDTAAAEDAPTAEDLYDISNGPAVFIFEGSSAQPQVQRFSFRNSRSSTDLRTYLGANEGDYFFTLMDFENVELPKDAQGNYIAQANTGYKLSISFNSPKGFLPVTYQYQVPNGLMVDGGEGSFVLKDGTNVGSWVVTDTGLITLSFNEKINSRTDIIISVALGIHFPEQNEPLDFDGKITVAVEKPPQQQFPTQVQKWGLQGNANADPPQDPKKIYWNVQIVGNKDSQIPGNIVSDKVLFGEWSKDHRYTESDIAGGLTFGVSEPDPVTGEFADWHSWHVSADDPHLIWTETGWSYKIPQTAVCQWCGEVELGNENWIYTINYTSSPDPAGSAGTYGYENEAVIDGQHAYAWTDFTHGEANGEITKTGSLVSDSNGGNYVWEFQATIPGRKQGKTADYHWYIMDYMYLLNAEGRLAGHAENDAHLALVTAEYNGTTIQVPRIQDATENDLFAWDNAWTATNNDIPYGREFNLLCRCHCNADNCQFWNGQCGGYWFVTDEGTWETNGYCQCWTPEETVTFTFAYATEASPLIDAYGGMGYRLQNVAELHYKPTGAPDGTLVSSSQVALSIPALFKKELTQDFNGYTAHYRITVNESKIVLSNGSPLTIHDVMTDTLAYISGSLVITSEDAVGNTSTLRQGVHYTVAYDGTGNQTDQDGKEVHVLDIVILQPQPVMYILDYDTTLIMPEHITGGIKYSNSASVSLWNKEISDTSVEKVYADINIAAKSFAVEMFKTCALTGKPLPGATFGLYNAQGGLITTGITDAGGRLAFQTNVIQGIILREHVPYYLQEIRPPTAYQLDDTKHWFCFCSSTEDACQSCMRILAETDAVRIPFEQIGSVDIVNYPAIVELPSTGGVGTPIFILCGLVLITLPLVYGFSLRRKYERRSQR